MPPVGIGPQRTSNILEKHRSLTYRHVDLLRVCVRVGLDILLVRLGKRLESVLEDRSTQAIFVRDIPGGQIVVGIVCAAQRG